MPSQWLTCLGIQPSIITVVGRWCIFFFLIQSFTFVNNNGNWTTGTFQALQTKIRKWISSTTSACGAVKCIRTCSFIQYFISLGHLHNRPAAAQERDLICAENRHRVTLVESADLGWHSSGSRCGSGIEERRAGRVREWNLRLVTWMASQPREGLHLHWVWVSFSFPCSFVARPEELEFCR